MNPELEKKRDVLAQEFVDGPNCRFTDSKLAHRESFAAGFNAAYDILSSDIAHWLEIISYPTKLKAENQRLRGALESWATFEEKEIERIGPYTKESKIPGFIARAREALKGAP